MMSFASWLTGSAGRFGVRLMAGFLGVMGNLSTLTNDNLDMWIRGARYPVIHIVNILLE